MYDKIHYKLKKKKKKKKPGTERSNNLPKGHSGKRMSETLTVVWVGCPWSPGELPGRPPASTSPTQAHVDVSCPEPYWNS